jgi:ketosteroid isomerase-like protein
MKRFLLVILLVVSSVGLVKAQETTGEKAEEAKKEILKIELDKISIHNANGDTTADWDMQNSAENVVNFSRGAFRTEPEVTASIRAGKTYIIDQKQYDHKVVIYNNGTVAVVTYKQDATFREDGKPVPHNNLCMNVWVKSPDGKWKRIAHVTEPAPKTGGTQ